MPQLSILVIIVLLLMDCYKNGKKEKKYLKEVRKT